MTTPPNPQLPPVFAKVLNDIQAVQLASARHVSATGQPVPCQPFLTECPLCKNDFRKCPMFSPSQEDSATGQASPSVAPAVYVGPALVAEPEDVVKKEEEK